CSRGRRLPAWPRISRASPAGALAGRPDVGRHDPAVADCVGAGEVLDMAGTDVGCRKVETDRVTRLAQLGQLLITSAREARDELLVALPGNHPGAEQGPSLPVVTRLDIAVVTGHHSPGVRDVRGGRWSRVGRLRRLARLRSLTCLRSRGLPPGRFRDGLRDGRSGMRRTRW